VLPDDPRVLAELGLRWTSTSTMAPCSPRHAGCATTRA
jgi:hypothetical protein